jgi:hypothetical protein
VAASASTRAEVRFMLPLLLLHFKCVPIQIRPPVSAHHTGRFGCMSGGSRIWSVLRAAVDFGTRAGALVKPRGPDVNASRGR